MAAEFGHGGHDVLHHYLDGRFGVVGAAAGEHFIQHHAEGVDVGTAVYVCRALGLLWADVVGCADRFFTGERGVAFPHLGNTKIREEGTAVLVKQNVVWLQIAVHDAHLVGRIQRLGHALQDGQRLGHRQRAVGQLLLERAALHQAHHQVRLTLLVAVVVHFDHVGMFEAGDGFGFALEPFEQAGLVQKRLGQHFQGHFTAGARVVGAVDGGHAPAPQLFFDFVATDCCW